MTSAFWKVPPGYLNTASFGVPPQRALGAVTEVIHLRVSFHFYNTVDDVDLALAGLRDTGPGTART